MDAASRPSGASKKAGGFPLGEFVRRRREELGYTQIELAERIGASQTYISNIERGHVRVPEQPYRRLLAEALRVSYVELMIGAGELERRDLPVGEYRPVIGNYQRKLDALPPEPRRRLEATIDDTLRAYGLDPGE